MSHDEAYRIAYLVAGHIRGTLTENEKDELDDWLTERDENIELFAELTDEKNLEDWITERKSYNSEAAIARLKHKILVEKPTARRGKIRAMYAVAAAVSILLVLFVVLKYDKLDRPVIETVSQTDVLPGTDKAILTLATGRQVVLDSNNKRDILIQDGLQVTDEGATLRYSGTASKAEWHILTTPRGGQYKLQLPDGTLVWLNAESSIRYPSVFDVRERKVQITGEVYFEVKKDDSKKFIAVAGGITTQVLGTHFNINAYGGNDNIAVTLEEGKVEVSDTVSHKQMALAPGGQAIWRNNAFTLSSGVNMEQILAWKNGWFYFHDAPIEDIMQQVQRWYNVDVRYEGKINYHFNADIERNVSVSKLLELLETTGRIHFDVKDKTIIVNP